MVNTMSSAHLNDGNAVGDGVAHAGAAAANQFNKLSGAWTTGAGVDDVNATSAASVTISGLDGSPYMASPTPLHSPETPNVDQVLFPPSVGGFGCLDAPFADYSPGTYGSGNATPAHFPVAFGHRTSASLSEGYDVNSATASPTTLYSRPARGVWPTHVSPAAFLPTPPMADELTGEDSVEEELGMTTRRKRPATDASAGVAKRSNGNKAKRPQTQLRTASRAPKKRTANTVHKPAESAEEDKARAAHNQVEQQYRKRLNAHFEKLLAVLPPPDEIEGGARDGIGDRRVSKAEVLDMARQRIRALEREAAALERERRELRGRIGGFEGQWGRQMRGTGL